MNTTDEIRRSALDTIDRHERLYRGAFLAAAVMEGLFIALFMTLMDFHNRMHVLIFIGTVASYSIILMGLVGLGSMLNRNTLRTIQAIEATAQRVPIV